MSTVLFILIIVIAAIILLAWLVGAFYLRGEDLSAFDQPGGERFTNSEQSSEALRDAEAAYVKLREAAQGVPQNRRIATLRDAMDNMFTDREFDASFIPVDCAGVPAEWVLAPGADASIRTLYIHGGSFVLGSPRSYRTLTSAFSEITGGAVLAIDYRLMPEHPRMAGIEDCRTAWRWMLENSPDGAQPANTVFIAGDSAGGNLALSLIAWIRDQRMRDPGLRDQGLRAPDAVVALSPGTDTTLASPSLRSNLQSDSVLGPSLEPLLKLPTTLLLWGGWMQLRINPSDPLISPVYGDLSRLPPVLIQVSETEMMRDDARRYVNRACAQGSPVRLQEWRNMIHVWHLFTPELPEAREALEEIRKFLADPASQRET